MRKIVYLLTAACILLSACAGAAGTPGMQGRPALALSDCQLTTPGLPLSIDAQCGTLSVFENRAAGTGRKIDLKIAVLPAINKHKAPDPVFFLAGGPGEAATESYLLVSSAFQSTNQMRDIVLVDQRGTGESNPLDCAANVENLIDFGEEDLKPMLETCLAGLDADPRFYTTPIAMDDLDEVRQALGYDQINLYGVSYGSRAALVYARQYPERVRTLVLDGIAPLGWTLGTDSSRYAQQALEKIFGRCESDPACGEKFPDLETKFRALIDRLKEAQVEIQMPDPTTSETRTVTFDDTFFTTTLFNLTYTPETVALIPLLVHTAYEREDYSLIAAQGLTLTGDLVSRLSDGMRYSVLCAEDLPYYTPQADGEGYLDDSAFESLLEACEVWPSGEIPEGYLEPVRSDVPTLILSGEADPVTPPENGELAAQTLPNSLHIVVSGQGHMNAFRGCLPKVVKNFYESGSTRGLDTSCIETIKPLPFFTSFSGPQP